MIARRRSAAGTAVYLKNGGTGRRRRRTKRHPAGAMCSIVTRVRAQISAANCQLTPMR
jgi:hypothetical protein